MTGVPLARDDMHSPRATGRPLSIHPAYLKVGGWLGDSIYFLKSEGKEVERKRIKNKKGCEGGVPVTIFLEVEIF